MSSPRACQPSLMAHGPTLGQSGQEQRVVVGAEGEDLPFEVEHAQRDPLQAPGSDVGHALGQRGKESVKGVNDDHGRDTRT